MMGHRISALRQERLLHQISIVSEAAVENDLGNR